MSSYPALFRYILNRRLLLTIWPFLAIAAAFVVLTTQSLNILSAGRAFVEGESLWSKAQKQSLVHLMRYAHTHSEADYEAFKSSLAVPHGDRTARLELEKPNPDYAVAYEGFLQGRNHPDDIPGMIMLFIRFRKVSYIDRSINLWADGDRSIDQFSEIAEELHERISRGESDPHRLYAVVERIFSMDARLTREEDAFSASLGEGMRKTKFLLSIGMFALAAILIPLVVVLTRRIRREAFERVRLSEERFDLAVSGTNDGIWDWNLQTDQIYCSPRLSELLGYVDHHPECTSSSLLARLHPDDREAAQLTLKLHLENDTPYDAEYRVWTEYGEYHWFRVRGRSVRDGSGRAVRMAGSITHITDRKQMEMTLERHRWFLEEVLNAIPQAVFVKDAQHRWVMFNEAFCEAMGQSRSALLGRSDFDFLCPEEARRSWGEDDDALASDDTVTFERSSSGPSGVLRSYLKHKKKVVTMGGEKYVVSIFTDITGLKQAQEALAQSEMRFRSLTTMSTDWYWEQDREFRVTFLSTGAFEVLGQAAFDSIQQTRWDHPSVDLASADWQAHKASCYAHKSFRNFEYRRFGGDGQLQWLSVSGEPMFDKAGSFEGYRGTGQDITQRVQAQDELRRHRDSLQQLVDERTHQLVLAKEAAEGANRAKSEFLTNMSHELRTPMHAILSFARLGVSKSKRGDIPVTKMRHYFERIDESGARLLRLLNDLLDLSKLEAGKMLYRMGSVEVAGIVRTAVAQLESLAREKGITVTIRTVDHALTAWCDAERLNQVLLNLLSNAIKFSRLDSPVTVSIEPDFLCVNGADMPALRVSVSDRGVGIPQAELQSVFDKFVQSSKTDSGSGGTGLGLAICQEIIEDHGGRIWAENLDDGARFSFVLPREPEPEGMETLALSQVA